MLITCILIGISISCGEKIYNRGRAGKVVYSNLLSKSPDLEKTVIICDKEWEKELSFPQIIQKEDKYIMYYITYNGLGARGFSTCYAESIDGLTWIKPALNLIEFNGSKANNIISNDFEGLSVEYNNGIYYLLTYAADFNTYLYKSYDGLKFSKVESFYIPYCCDSQNQIFWNPKTKKYQLYFRSWYKSENKNITYNHTDSMYRAVSYMETSTPEEINIPLSPDPLWRWGENSGIPPALSSELPVVMQNTSNDDYDIYNSCVHRYNDGSFIAYPIIYWHLPEPPQGGATFNDGYTRLGMWTSKNGKDFTIITNDYLRFGDSWFELAIGHIETKTELIHYYVKFHKTHGDTTLDNESEIIARVHKKK